MHYLSFVDIHYALNGDDFVWDADKARQNHAQAWHRV